VAWEQERSTSIEHRMVLLGYSGPKPPGEPLGFLIKLKSLQKKPKLVVWKVRVRKAGYLQGIDPSWCLVEGKGAKILALRSEVAADEAMAAPELAEMRPEVWQSQG
jgi:hypothetical protein